MVFDSETASTVSCKPIRKGGNIWCWILRLFPQLHLCLFFLLSLSFLYGPALCISTYLHSYKNIFYKWNLHNIHHGKFYYQDTIFGKNTLRMTESVLISTQKVNNNHNKKTDFTNDNSIGMYAYERQATWMAEIHISPPPIPLLVYCTCRGGHHKRHPSHYWYTCRGGHHKRHPSQNWYTRRGGHPKRYHHIGKYAVQRSAPQTPLPPIIGIHAE